MMPQTDSFLAEGIIFDTMPSKTWKIDGNRVTDTIDGSEALAQAVFLMLATENGEHDIYTTDYGRAFDRLIGANADFAAAEIEREVRETLLVDTRIKSVDDFAFTREGSMITATFTVHADDTEITGSTEVTI